MDKEIEKIKPKKELGQNFLLSKKPINQIIYSAQLTNEDVVLEIGAGTGSLSEELIAKGVKRLILIEKDEELVLILEKKFSKDKNVDIIQGDVREFFSKDRLEIINQPYKIVANLPYYLSSFLIRRLLEIKNKPKTIVLTLQKELAERICAKPGKMSLISVMVNFYGSPSLGEIIKKEEFYPIPKGDSRILIIKDIKKPENIDEKVFFRVIRVGFSSKRKMLIGNLKNGFRLSKKQLLSLFRDIGINEKSRAQELSLEEWKELTNKIVKIIS